MKIALALCFVLSSSVQAQTFVTVPQEPAMQVPAWSVAGPRPHSKHLVHVDINAHDAGLATTPSERADQPLAAYGQPIGLPHPDGGVVACVIAESPVMAPELQARYPQLRSFLVQSIDRSASGRIEFTPRGLTGMLRTTDGRAWMIDQWQSGDSTLAVSYWLTDLPGSTDWVCETIAGAQLAEPAGDTEGGHVLRGAHELRTVRFAAACTGEYGLHQCTVQGNPPNLVDPLAAIMVVTSRTNVVYEADMAVRFVLVANNDEIVYINASTDPYPTTCEGVGGGDCSGGYLSPNISNLSQVIGNENFDLGHLLTRVFGGVAYLGSICGQSKAGGISGIPRGGDVDPLSALVVIHEIGHQLGANHTFSGIRGRCAGNVNIPTAWEAGSGSSPMAYAGGCPVGDAPPSDNIVQFCDPFFHSGSVREMMTLLAMRNCPQLTPTGNSPPSIVSVSPDRFVPLATPFELTVQATDADGDPLTYSWEQFDGGAARPIIGEGAVDNGQGALFRIFPPVTDPTRVFPQWSDILSGAATPGEMLPTAGNTQRRFRVIVRDNAPGGGGVVVSDLVRLTLVTNTGPFAVTTPSDGQSLESGSVTVEWSLGGTNLWPISCTSVTISLSTDGGQTFDVPLGTFSNTGSAIVELPELDSAVGHARIRITPTDNVFFAVSRPFSIAGTCGADFDGNGMVEVPDIFTFLAAWFAQDPQADVDGLPGVTVPDIFEFLSAWFAGC